MTAWYAMARRNAIVALACALIGVAIVLSVVVPAFHGAAVGVLRAVNDLVGEPLVERCTADPAAFRMERGGIRILGYDADTLLSANPTTPPPDPELVAAYRAGDNAALRLYLDGEWGGAALLRTGHPGPCGAAEVRWTRPEGIRPRFLVALLGGLIVSLVLATALATTLTVRPLLRRLDGLRAAATRIGTPDYVPAPRAPGDPLDVLAEVMDDAHARSVRTRDEEAARRRAMEEHLDDVAHDLRTPLAALQLRLEEAAGAAPGPLRVTLDEALGDLTYLTQLTANLRVGAALRGPLGDEDADLTEVVARVVARFAIIGRHAGVEVAGVVPDVPLRVACAPVLAEQAVANLVHNAVRYNRPGGHVSVLLTSTPAGFRLEVADDGPGVPPERLPALTAGEPGRGHLGLAITVAVCRRAGWDFTLAGLSPTGLQAVIQA